MDIWEGWTHPFRVAGVASKHIIKHMHLAWTLVLLPLGDGKIQEAKKGITTNAPNQGPWGVPYMCMYD